MEDTSMMVVRVLKRKDAASVVVGVVIALIVAQFLQIVMQDLANKIALWQWDNANNGFGGAPSTFRVMYVQPFVGMLLQLIGLEILVRLYVWLHTMVVKKR